MKRLLVVFVLVAGITAVAFASLNNNRKKAGTEKKEKPAKKVCKHSCMFS